MKEWIVSLPAQGKTIFMLGCLLIVLLFVMVFMPLLSWNLESVQRIEQAQPRIGRLLGFEGSTETLESALRSSRVAMDSFLHRREAGEASVGSAAQRQLRQIAEGAGFTVQGSQVMAPVSDDELIDTRVGVDLIGDLESLEGFLDALGQERPFLLPRELKLSPINARRGQPQAQNVSVKFVVSAFSQPTQGVTP